MHDDYDDDAPDPCPACGGPGVLLGGLGNFNHYRCAACGAQFHQRIEDDYDTDDDRV